MLLICDVVGLGVSLSGGAGLQPVGVSCCEIVLAATKPHRLQVCATPRFDSSLVDGDIYRGRGAPEGVCGVESVGGRLAGRYGDAGAADRAYVRRDDQIGRAGDVPG